MTWSLRRSRCRCPRSGPCPACPSSTTPSYRPSSPCCRSRSPSSRYAPTTHLSIPFRPSCPKPCPLAHALTLCLSPLLFHHRVLRVRVRRSRRRRWCTTWPSRTWARSSCARPPTSPSIRSDLPYLPLPPSFPANETLQRGLEAFQPILKGLQRGLDASGKLMCLMPFLSTCLVVLSMLQLTEKIHATGLRVVRLCAKSREAVASSVRQPILQPLTRP